MQNRDRMSRVRIAEGHLQNIGIVHRRNSKSINYRFRLGITWCGSWRLCHRLQCIFDDDWTTNKLTLGYQESPVRAQQILLVRAESFELDQHPSSDFEERLFSAYVSSSQTNCEGGRKQQKPFVFPKDPPIKQI